MSKIYFFVFAIMLTANFTTAQVKFGAKAGLNISNVHSERNKDFKNLLAYNLGVVSKFSATNKIGITAEVLLSQKGFKSLMIPSGTTYNKLTYLSIPVLIEYKPVKALYIQVGPELSYLLSAKLKNSTLHKSERDNYNKFDVGIAGGVGYTIFKNFSLEARYVYGLSQISQYTDVTGKYYNRVFQFNAVYLFKR